MSFYEWIQGIFDILVIDLDTGYFTPKQLIVLLAFVFCIELFFNIISSLFDLCKGR